MLTGLFLATAAAQTAAAAPAGVAHKHGVTVVSLTFDDGDADQMIAARLMRAYHLHGTFYIITGAVGTPGYFTRRDLTTLAANGNEIGGHTVNHLDLTQIPQAQAHQQACQSRDTLAAWGFHATSFAYPGGTVTPQTEAIAAGCGFTSARTITGLGPYCSFCVPAESIPPANPYAIRTPGQVGLSGFSGLTKLERVVEDARAHGGGWLPLVFHHICTSVCGAASIQASTFGAFVAWLARRAGPGVEVRTVGQVIGKPWRPLVPVKPASPHPLFNPSLESLGAPGIVGFGGEEAGGPHSVPACWMLGGYGQNNAHWQRVQHAHAGRWAQRVTITGYVSGDAELFQRLDDGGCSLQVRPGRSYQLTTWYKSSAHVQFGVYSRNPVGRWAYWTSSPYFPPSQTWAKASWQTPAVPAGTAGMSFGLALATNGSLTTDSYSFRLAPPNLIHRFLDWALLGVVVVAGARGAYRLLTRRRRRTSDSTADAGQPARASGDPPSALPPSRR